MKATHKGRLKNIQDLIEALRNDISINNISKEYIGFLSDNEGAIIEVEEYLKGNFKNYDFGFITEMFSKLEPIKPKKETRPFTDEEWKTWFLEDGICQFITTIQRASKISVKDEEEFIYFHRWFSKDYFIKNAVDRHGNKFEKEL